MGGPDDHTLSETPAALSLKRRVVVAVYAVATPTTKELDREWHPGPLPLRISPEEITDERWRVQFVHARLQSALYDGARRAYWMSPESSAQTIPGTRFVIAAAELLRFRAGPRDRPNALAAIHLLPKSDGKAMIGEMKMVTRDLDRPPAARILEFVESVLPRGTQISRRERHATLLTFATHQPESPLIGTSRWSVEEPSTWSALDRWRWSLAMASPPSKNALVAPELPEAPGRLVAIPRRDVQVVHSGVAILGTRDDRGARHSDEYVKDETRTRTIFLDALLLGVVQRVLVEQLANDAARCGDPARSRRRFRELQRDVRIFRNVYWWREFSTWRWPDAVLRAYQDEHAMDRQVDGLTSEVADYAGEVGAANSERTNLALGLLAVIGVPGVVATVLATLGSSSDSAAKWLWASAAVIGIPAIAGVVALIRSQVGRHSDDYVEEP
jgi:hypothetical protein